MTNTKDWRLASCHFKVDTQREVEGSLTFDTEFPTETDAQSPDETTRAESASALLSLQKWWSVDAVVPLTTEIDWGLRTPLAQPDVAVQQAYRAWGELGSRCLVTADFSARDSGSWDREGLRDLLIDRIQPDQRSQFYRFERRIIHKNTADRSDHRPSAITELDLCIFGYCCRMGSVEWEMKLPPFFTQKRYFRVDLNLKCI